MGRAPLLLPFLGLVGGILLAEFALWFPFWGVILIFVIGLSGAIFLPGNLSYFLIFCALGWGFREVHRPASLQFEGHHEFSAKVIQASETSRSETMTILTIDSVDGRRFSPFNVSAQIVSNEKEIGSGLRIGFRGVMRPLERPFIHEDIVNKNSMEERLGAVGFIRIRPDSLELRGEAGGVGAFMARLNRKLVNRLSQSDISDRTFALLSAMLLADREDLQPSEVKTFSASGLSHLLALSGTHVAVIATLISFALFPLTIARRKKWRYVVTILILWFYAALTGMAPSVVRASVMASVYLFGRVIERSSVAINSLCLAGIVILLFNPVDLFQPGFQMSFAAVAGIIIFFPLLNQINRFKHPRAYRLWSYPALSISATILTSLVSAWYFHTFALYFLFANLLVIPFIPLILIAGVLLLIMPYSQLLGQQADFLCDLLERIARWIASFPGAVVGDIYLPLWLSVAMFLLLVVFGVSLHYRKRAYVIASVMLMVFSVSANWLSPPQFPIYEEFEVDGGRVVRRGDSLYVEADYRNRAEYEMMQRKFTRRLRHYCARRKLPPPVLRRK